MSLKANEEGFNREPQPATTQRAGYSRSGLNREIGAQYLNAIKVLKCLPPGTSPQSRGQVLRYVTENPGVTADPGTADEKLASILNALSNPQVEPPAANRITVRRLNPNEPPVKRLSIQDLDREIEAFQKDVTSPKR